MGSGGSTPKQVAGRRISIHDTTPGDVMLKRRNSGGLQASDQIDTRLHFEQCKNPDLVQKVNSIREAYKLTDEKKTVISKPTRIGRRSFKYEVSVGLPQKIHCDLCGKFIVDFQGNADFYCCFGCRNRGRKFEMCESCYSSRALDEIKKTGDPLSFRKGKGFIELRRSRQEENVESDSGSKSSAPSLPPKAPVRASSKVSDLNIGISGVWAAKITADKAVRQEKRIIEAFADGKLKGTTCTGCKLEGRFDNNTIQWTEAHTWGQVTFKGTLDVASKRCSLSGDFVATDGGKGTLTATKT
jgi:hypothetical protein